VVPFECKASWQSALSRAKVASEVPGLYHFTGSFEQLMKPRVAIRARHKAIPSFFIFFPHPSREEEEEIVMIFSQVFNQKGESMTKSLKGIIDQAM
jgi:hypothetical protein